MRRTKIIATLGPVSRTEATLTEMVKAGMNVARLNFSHGTHEYHAETIALVDKVRKELGRPIAIMLDTKGPEIRTKLVKGGSATLKSGKEFILTSRPVEGDDTCVSVTYPTLAGEVPIGTTVLIDDGKIELIAVKKTETDLVCKIVRGGELGEKKGVNVPSVKLDMPYLSEADKDDLRFGIEHGIDYIAASFVRSKDDVHELRKFVDYYDGHDVKIIAKIESSDGVKNFDEILRAADGIMVARGDMGVEVDYTRLPGLQKQFIRKCYQSGKTVITATQMLESMIQSPTPTRAEITDVANAVFDGTSAVMLSGETAAGNYPVEAVRVMARVAEQAENDAFEMKAYKNIPYDLDAGDVTNAICDAACTTARDLSAKAIIALTMSGTTARSTSKFRPVEPIVAATPSEKTFNQLALSWGVYPVLARHKTNSEELFTHAVDCAKMLDIVGTGDTVVIVAGIPLDVPGKTNTLKVATVS